MLAEESEKKILFFIQMLDTFCSNKITKIAKQGQTQPRSHGFSSFRLPGVRAAGR